MIVFNGYLTGKANEFFMKKILNRATILIVFLFIFTIPVWSVLSMWVGAFIETMSTLLICMLCSPLLFRLCFSKKMKQQNNLKKVIINEGVITAVSDKTTITNNIVDIKEVQDFGDFYYIVFPYRYVSSIYVCQKNLLSKGTLEEFETLFEDKIRLKS